MKKLFYSKQDFYQFMVLVGFCAHGTQPLVAITYGFMGHSLVSRFQTFFIENPKTQNGPNASKPHGIGWGGGVGPKTKSSSKAHGDKVTLGPQGVPPVFPISGLAPIRLWLRLRQIYRVPSIRSHSKNSSFLHFQCKTPLFDPLFLIFHEIIFDENCCENTAISLKMVIQSSLR